MHTAGLTEALHLRDDWRVPCRVLSDDLPWTPSPASGVMRRLLERSGGEVARATSIVRYAAGSRFSSHVHELGEEILVLAGVFSDEAGDHPAGTWLLNPPGSAHAPFSRAGCTLFVKLRYQPPTDTTRGRIDTRRTPFTPSHQPGVSALQLLAGGTAEHPIHAGMQRWLPGAEGLQGPAQDGQEIFVVEGCYEDPRGVHPAGTWLRAPEAAAVPARSSQGCLLWVKTGHLGPRPPLGAAA